MPVKVVKKVVSLQRSFLWGGVRSVGHKTCWVKWSKISQPKDKGGLGVKDVMKMNNSLLAKWRWRILCEDNFLWKSVLVSKYGPMVGRRVELGERGGRHTLHVGGVI